MKRYGWGIVDKNGRHPLNSAVELKREHAFFYVDHVNQDKARFPDGPYRVVELFYREVSHNHE